MGAGFTNVEAQERSGERVSFSFGRNWQKFLQGISSSQVASSRAALACSFNRERFDGTFLDIGSGSGLFSLAARKLGATRVVSVDIDPNSIACARALGAVEDDNGDWVVRQGSILDPGFVRALPESDYVYSWGVLHHTGAMWEAIENTISRIAPGGLCCLALYRAPRRVAAHMALKRVYNVAPRAAKTALVAAYVGALTLRLAVAQRKTPRAVVRGYAANSRGMSLWRDAEDWLGGLPCEFVSGDAVQHLVESRGLDMLRVLEAPPGGNYEFLIRRPAA